MKPRVCITGLGVISSIGIGKDAFWENLLEGKSGISLVSCFDTTDQFTHKGGEVKNFHPENFISPDRLPALSRASQFALCAAYLALEDAKLSFEILPDTRSGVCLGTTLGSIQAIEEIDELIILQGRKRFRETVISQIPPHSTSSLIAKEFNVKGPNLMVSTACAAGNYAIGYGFDLIRLGKADIVLSGASDAFSKISFTGFNQFSAVAPDKCQPFDKNRKGMIVGEGAGILVLESLESAIKRQSPIYAEILGYGLSCDARHMTSPSSEGIAECITRALNEAGIKKEEVDYISAHGTGTLTNDKAECTGIKNVFGALYQKIPVSSIKSMLGHAMGAASALEAIACALTVKHGIIPPTINFETPDPDCDIDCVPNQARKQKVTIAMNNSYAFGGNNASLILKKIPIEMVEGKNV